MIYLQSFQILGCGRGGGGPKLMQVQPLTRALFQQSSGCRTSFLFNSLKRLAAVAARLGVRLVGGQRMYPRRPSQRIYCCQLPYFAPCLLLLLLAQHLKSERAAHCLRSPGASFGLCGVRVDKEDTCVRVKKSCDNNVSLSY